MQNESKSIIVSLLILGKALTDFLLDFFMRLIHITDPHLSSLASFSFLTVKGKRKSGYLSWYRQRRYIHRPEILERLTQAVHDESPDQILLTGDLIHIGLEDEMIEAARWLKTLGPPGQVQLIPGNHDNYAPDSLAAMNRHWGEYLPAPEEGINDYAGAYPVVRVIDGIQLIAVNTSCVTRIFSAEGELGKAQLSRLREAMDAPLSHLPDGTPDLSVFTCLLIHHPPLPGMANSVKPFVMHGNYRSSSMNSNRIWSFTAISTATVTRPTGKSVHSARLQHRACLMLHTGFLTSKRPIRAGIAICG